IALNRTDVCTMMGSPAMARTEYFEIVAKSALNRVQHMDFNWSLNPCQGCFHSCVYCFARAHAKLADRDPGAGFSARVGVKVNVPELLRRELSGRGWKRETVAFGTATDPYQPIEGTYRLTRRCLEAFRDFKTPVGLITKGTMVIRDIDVLVELSRQAKTTVCFSIPTVDETVWAKTEPGTPPPQKRLKVLKALVDAGIEAGVGMAPVPPGLSDSPGQLEATVAAAAGGGARLLLGHNVCLKPRTKKHFLAILRRGDPPPLPKKPGVVPGGPAPSAVVEPTESEAATTVEPVQALAAVELPTATAEAEAKETCPTCGRTSVFAGPPGQRFCTYCALRDELFERSAAATE